MKNNAVLLMLQAQYNGENTEVRNLEFLCVVENKYEFSYEVHRHDQIIFKKVFIERQLDENYPPLCKHCAACTNDRNHFDYLGKCNHGS